MLSLASLGSSILFVDAFLSRHGFPAARSNAYDVLGPPASATQYVDPRIRTDLEAAFSDSTNLNEVHSEARVHWYYAQKKMQWT
jgi:hypothetical protein